MASPSKTSSARTLPSRAPVIVPGVLLGIVGHKEGCQPRGWIFQMMRFIENLEVASEIWPWQGSMAIWSAAHR